MKIDMLRVRSLTAAIVLVAIAAWLAVSNHCALSAATVPEAKAAQSECPFHSHPPKPAKQKDSSDQPCCKILRAVTTAPTKSFAPAIVDLHAVDFDFAKFVTFAAAKISIVLATLDTGPPGALSFTELILQSSLLANAPPSRG
jgi:hypothetical protein